MRHSIALLLLAPVGLAGIVSNCPPSAAHCAYSATETIVNNVVTIDFTAESDLGGTFTLNETLVTDGLGGVPEFVGSADLNLTAGALGATASGALGVYGCEAVSSGIPGPDTPPVVDNCYTGGAVFFSNDVQIPVSMEINLGPGGSGGVDLQASLFELNTETGQTRPLTAQFLVPEPSSIALCGIGLAGLLLRRQRGAPRSST